MKICEILGCDKPFYAKGVCVMHRTRFRRYGTYERSKYRDKCTKKDCNKKHFAKGLCRTHYKVTVREHDNLLQRIRRHKYLKKTRQQCNDWHIKNSEKLNQKRQTFLNKLLSSSQTFENANYLFWNWANSIKKRYKKCVICDDSTKTDAHHIFSKTKYLGLALNLNNGIVVCIKHHEEIHTLNSSFFSQTPIRYR